MVRFDISKLRNLSKHDIRVLTSIEMGMKNHKVVPIQLIEKISGFKKGLLNRSIEELHKYKLIFHDAKRYDGYRLTFLGYDYLALNALSNRGVVISVGNKIGVGKESDVFECLNSNRQKMVLKIHRLGRVCFSSVKEKRSYHQHRSYASWLYLSRLAAQREFAYMKVLKNHGFPIPEPIDVNRHVVVMSFIDGSLLNSHYSISHITSDEVNNNNELYLQRIQQSAPSIKDIANVYEQCISCIIKFAQHGLIHCDFNPFNIIIDSNNIITVFDFPQMVSLHHPNAEDLFDRDVSGIASFFEKKYKFIGSIPSLNTIIPTMDLNSLVRSAREERVSDEINFTDRNKEDDLFLELTSRNEEIKTNKDDIDLEEDDYEEDGDILEEEYEN